VVICYLNVSSDADVYRQSTQLLLTHLKPTPVDVLCTALLCLSVSVFFPISAHIPNVFCQMLLSAGLQNSPGVAAAEKPGLDQGQVSNCRLISNLSTVSVVIEQLHHVRDSLSHTQGPSDINTSIPEWPHKPHIAYKTSALILSPLMSVPKTRTDVVCLELAPEQYSFVHFHRYFEVTFKNTPIYLVLA